jgi:hypothetical protein
MATPIITPAMLTANPAGLSWQVVPTLTASTQQQLGQLEVVCWTATSDAETYCRQPLRATLVTETERGPGAPRIAVERDTGIGTIIARQSPVTSVLAIQTSPARAFPPCWTLVPPGQYGVKHEVLMPQPGIPVEGPSGGTSIEVAPGWIDWTYGRGGTKVSWSVTTGYPHAGITTAIPAGNPDNVDQLDTDDVTAWTGWTGFIFDGPYTEIVTVESAAATVPVTLPGIGGTANAGPGTLTLSAPLQYGHAAGTVISAIPLNAIHGVALKAAVQALETIDAIATQSLSGQMAGGTGVLAEQAEMNLDDFRRVS